MSTLNDILTNIKGSLGKSFNTMRGQISAIFNKAYSLKDKGNGRNFYKEGSKIFFNEKKQMQLLDKAISGTITEEEIQTFAESLVIMHIKLNARPLDLNSPTIESSTLEDTTSGNFDGNYRRILYSKQKYVDGDTSSFKDKVINFINTIGHEMTHEIQDEYSKFFDLNNSPTEDFDFFKRQIISSYRNNPNPSSKDMEILRKFLSSHLSSDELPEGFESEEEFNKFLAYIKYNNLPYEIDARKGGIEFVKQLFSVWDKSKFKTPQIEKWLNENISTIQDMEVRESKTNYNSWANRDMPDKYNPNEDIIFKVASENEDGLNYRTKKITNMLNKSDYIRFLNLSIGELSSFNKTNLLDIALEKGFVYLGNACLSSLSNEIDLSISYKRKLKRTLSDGDILSFDGEPHISKLNSNSYEMNLDKLLSPNEISEVVIKLLKTKPLFAVKLFKNNENKFDSAALKNIEQSVVSSIEQLLNGEINITNPADLSEFFYNFMSKNEEDLSQNPNDTGLIEKNKFYNEIKEKLNTANLKTTEKDFMRVYGQRQLDIEMANLKDNLQSILDRKGVFVKFLCFSIKDNEISENSIKMELIRDILPFSLSHLDSPTIQKFIDDIFDENKMKLFELIKEEYPDVKINLEQQDQNKPKKNPQEILDSLLNKNDDAAFEKFLVEFATFNKQLYLKGLENCSPEEISKNKNYIEIMKKVVANRIQNYKSQGDNGAAGIDQWSTLIDDKLFDKIASDKHEQLKLLEIAINGTYEKNGVKVFLTTKDCTKLASLIEKLLDKNIQKITSKNTGDLQSSQNSTKQNLELDEQNQMN